MTLPTMRVRPYFEGGGIRLYHADCRSAVEVEWLNADVLVTDPPYGIDYNSGARRANLAASIEGDKDTSLRDGVLERWDGPALVFGTWRIPRPAGTHTRLIWDTKGALGMGDLSVPWKPSDQEVYVIGKGFIGRRDTNVLRFAPVQAMAQNGRLHPHEKPVSLMYALLQKTRGIVADPFAGSGSTLVAAARLGRPAVGVEIDEGYCATAVERIRAELAQPSLLGEAA